MSAVIGCAVIATESVTGSSESVRNLTIVTKDGENGVTASDLVGRHGSRNMDPTVGLVVRITREALEKYRDAVGSINSAATGLVVGTTTGSPASMISLTTDTWTQRRPYLIEAGTIPYAILNGAAARAAIWHELRGPNATVGGTEVSIIKALEYSLTLLETGRAEVMLCAAGEEKTPQSTWLRDVANEGTAAMASGAGAIVLSLDKSAPWATCLVREIGSCFCGSSEQMAEILITHVRSVLSEHADSNIMTVIGAGLQHISRLNDMWSSSFLDSMPFVEHIEDVEGDYGAAGGFLALSVALSRITASRPLSDANATARCSALVLLANSRSEVGWLLVENISSLNTNAKE